MCSYTTSYNSTFYRVNHTVLLDYCQHIQHFRHLVKKVSIIMILRCLLYQFVLTSILMCSGLDLSEVYIMSTAPDEQCHIGQDPCITLSHFAANFNSYHNLTSNMSLVFLPGNHSLQLELLATDISTISLHSNSNSFLPTKIKCEFLGSFDFHSITWIHIDGLEFMGCTFKFSFVNQLIVEETAFNGQENGTAIELFASIVKSIFSLNLVGG